MYCFEIQRKENRNKHSTNFKESLWLENGSLADEDDDDDDKEVSTYIMGGTR
jgi:hypothetical protein